MKIGKEITLQELSELFSKYAYSSYHGIKSNFLGTGILNFSIPYSIKAKTCLCIGSGGGVVPALMSIAQEQALVDEPMTVLVDANMIEAGMGSPQRDGGWMTENNDFLKRFPEVKIFVETSQEFFENFNDRFDFTIDYLAYRR